MERSSGDVSTNVGLREVSHDVLELGRLRHHRTLRRHLAQLCDDLGIVATGGSDYHGSYKPELSVGTGRGDLRVPDEAVDQLIEERNGPPLQPR